MAESTAPLEQAIGKLASGASITEGLAVEAFGALISGEATAAQTAALLMGLRVRGERAEELAGAVRALRKAMVVVEAPNTGPVIDTCGTGGGRVPTFNISTAAAFVAAGAGAMVAKHGNRSFTSKCGSADLLEALGVDISADAQRAAELLRDVGMAFLFAPNFHPAMRFVGPVRRELAVGTIMNLVGPLANPARVTRQVVGVADGERGPLIAAALGRLGAEHALVVHGTVGMDEIAPVGPTDVWEVRSGDVREWSIDPSHYKLQEANPQALAGGTPDANASRVEQLLEHPEGDPHGRTAVALNAGSALYVAGLADTVAEGVDRAMSALEDGAAADVLARLRA